MGARCDQPNLPGIWQEGDSDMQRHPDITRFRAEQARIKSQVTGDNCGWCFACGSQVWTPDREIRRLERCDVCGLHAVHPLEIVEAVFRGRDSMVRRSLALQAIPDRRDREQGGL